MRRSLVLVAVLAVLAAGTASAARRDTTLSLVAYSVPTAVYPKLIAAYQATPQGRNVKFATSFAGSEVQAKAVVAGLPADVVNFSLQPDMDELVRAGLVAKTWDANPYRGIVSKSVVVFVLHDGNPKHIRTWDDLVKPGVQVVLPNPFLSGGARWDVLAAYGSQLREGKTPKQALAYLQQLFEHVVSQDTSARNAQNTFLAGRGDVLIDYESNAKLAQSQGRPIFYLIPKATLQIETPIAAVDGSNRAAAQRFVTWLTAPAAQTIWAQNGFRSVVPSVEKRFAAQFPPRPLLFTISWLGGWSKLNPRFFDPTNGIVTKIEQGLGVSTGG